MDGIGDTAQNHESEFLHKRVSRLPATMSGMLKDEDPGLSRREFLSAAMGAGGAMLLGPAWMNAVETRIRP
jgi:hypothetical protein